MPSERSLRFHALACDYDGTLAHDGRVSPETVAALKRLSASGRKLVLVTGRELKELLTIFPEVTLFDWVVAENGGLLYEPKTKAETPLAEAPPLDFLRALERRRVEPVSVGRVIVATWEPHQAAVLEAIKELGLELQVIFNKGAVMILPSGVNKASGLAAALERMGLSPHNVVAVGDAENDHALLAACECAVAVQNALPALREKADLVTEAGHGAGVTELIDRIVSDDLASLDLGRHFLPLGKDRDGKEVRIPPFGMNVLVSGSSGSGKSTFTTGVIERLTERGYQYCVIDPEGDYETLDGAVTLGDAKRAPGADETVEVLGHPGTNAVVSMIGLPLQERPSFFLKLLPKLLELRARTARPHWLIVDEAHHMLPGPWELVSVPFPAQVENMLFITLDPQAVSRDILATVDVFVAVGEQHGRTVKSFADSLGIATPPLDDRPLDPGEVLVWFRKTSDPPVRMRIPPSKIERRRHSRKYAEGELPPDRSFYFRGEHEKLNLRAQNLIVFLQLADGVDDETWTYHLRRGDYSRWLSTQVKDPTLGAEVAAAEQDESLSPKESRARVKAAIEAVYTLPASISTPGSGNQRR